MRHLRIYEAIRTIVKTGSIRRASEYQRISPSALNRAVLAFEEEIGVEIFDRLPSGVRLSVPGELLYYHLEDHLTRMSDFSALLAEMKGMSAGTLRLSVSGDLVQFFLPDILSEYRAAYPGIETQIEISETSEALAARDTDLALVTRPETNKGVAVALFHESAILGRVARDHKGEALSLADLPDHALLLPPTGSGLRDIVDLTLRKNDIEPRATHIYPGVYPALNAAPPDLQFVLACNAGEAVRQGARLIPLTGLRLPPVQVTLLKRCDGTLPRAAERFVNILQARFNRLC